MVYRYEFPFLISGTRTRNAPFDTSGVQGGELKQIGSLLHDCVENEEHYSTPIPDTIDPFFLLDITVDNSGDPSK